MPTLYRKIVRPIVTEQSSAAYQERGEYTFQVHPDATKPEIRRAIEQLFARARHRCVDVEPARQGKAHGEDGRPQGALEKGSRDAP